MLGNRRLGQGEPFDQVSDRFLAGPQQIENLPAARFRENLKR